MSSRKKAILVIFLYIFLPVIGISQISLKSKGDNSPSVIAKDISITYNVANGGKTDESDHPIPEQIDHPYRSKLTT